MPTLPYTTVLDAFRRGQQGKTGWPLVIPPRGSIRFPLKALRSGIFASYAIGDLLTRHDESGLERYRRFVRDEFKSYAEVRTKYYREEQRWPEREFWLRRHAGADFGKTIARASGVTTTHSKVDGVTKLLADTNHLLREQP